MIIVDLISKSAVQYMKHFIYHFTLCTFAAIIATETKVVMPY